MRSRKPGSINDLLPRKGSAEYLALSPFLRDQVDLICKGYRPLAPGDLEDIAKVPGRVEALAIEQAVLASNIRDVHKAQSELGSQILARLDEIVKEQAEHRAQLNDHDKRLDGHDIQLGVHAKKHLEHATEITGIHQRVSLVEKHLITKRPKRRGKTARK
jgi:hypothetical protein